MEQPNHPNPRPGPVLLDVRDLAALLKISPTAVYRLVERRTVPFHRIPAGLRFRLSDVEAYLLQHRVGPIIDN